MKWKYSNQLLVLALLFLLSAFTITMRSSVPPQGYTGADGVYCTQCHATNALNTMGGEVVLSGLPQTYEAGKVYNFQIAIKHAATDRRRWGFSVLARNAAGQNVGSFSSNNNNAAINGSELSHTNAVPTADAQLYSYQNLVWTAPASPGPDDAAITFYVTGLAGNGSGSSGDFVYASTFNMGLQATATAFEFVGKGSWSDPLNWKNNQLPPAILEGNFSIIINPAAQDTCVLDVPQTLKGGATLTVAEGKAFVINGNLTIQQQ
jgi:hypothetical protein